MIVVDDGSRQECQHIFEDLSEQSGCVVLHHEINQGKGRVLKTAFSHYLKSYPEYWGVVTADADGQHLPTDIYRTAQAILIASVHECTPLGSHVGNTMALGTRNFDEEQVPFKSRNGNKITTRAFKLLFGKWINDTQTGLRAISNGFIPMCLEIKGERFEYEINVPICAVKQRLDIIEVPIETVYFDNNRETHFHPIKDSARIYLIMLASFFVSADRESSRS